MQGAPPNTLPPDDAALLRGFLAGQDAPCPACGYNLRGSTSDRCPECATVLALSLARASDKPAVRHALTTVSLQALAYVVTGVDWVILWSTAGVLAGSWLYAGSFVVRIVILAICFRRVVRGARAPHEPGRAALIAAVWTFGVLSAISLLQGGAMLVSRLL